MAAERSHVVTYSVADKGLMFAAETVKNLAFPEMKLADSQTGRQDLQADILRAIQSWCAASASNIRAALPL